MKFSGIFSLIIGAMMILQWGFFIISGQVPELQVEPIRIAFHLAAEGLTALALIISGIGLLNKRTWGRKTALIAFGMLLYTSLVSPGYFAQQGLWPLVGMFVIIFAMALVSIRMLNLKEID